MLKISTSASFHKNIFLCLAAMTALASCSASVEERIGKRAVAFASAYYNFRFHHALSLCTKESEKWIKFQASNIRQSDLDAYNGMADSAQCSAVSVTLDTDTSATVFLNVNNYVMTDSLRRNGSIGKNAQLTLKMKKRSGKWQVSLDALPKASATD